MKPRTSWWRSFKRGLIRGASQALVIVFVGGMTGVALTVIALVVLEATGVLE
jgi:hypothetical protein